MFTHLTKPLEKGAKVAATLNFEHAGAVQSSSRSRPSGAAASAKGDDMKGMKM